MFNLTDSIQGKEYKVVVHGVAPTKSRYSYTNMYGAEVFYDISQLHGYDLFVSLEVEGKSYLNEFAGFFEEMPSDEELEKIARRFRVYGMIFALGIIKHFSISNTNPEEFLECMWWYPDLERGLDFFDDGTGSCTNVQEYLEQTYGAKF